ncbi:hypothetical protein ASPZODRAFT_169197 [Penicilliopsis zonata CBS 506.65]|uniref:Oleate hydratase n=1 Tax=Penicilliopsis zonata CBS 506.65 TaxID=1073090 RepID=A0A1L9S8L4_9EURO|nr:hypothetical protein ASPZODRAFT_169197 [Penicilliopsis zonata CBS 506.65]OJJ43503.1 hypothetical protein ASPZODRAFT_169197 [Penicilliopsis zonata CBS 506.65]
MNEMPRRTSSSPPRDPEQTQAWLVGGGIASLAAAVHLLRDAGLPGRNIHILDLHEQVGGGMASSGDATHGFVVHLSGQPYFHDACVENLLALVPGGDGHNAERTLLSQIRAFEWNEGRRLEEALDGSGLQPVLRPRAQTRFVRNPGQTAVRSDSSRLAIGPYSRLQLIKILLEAETALDGRRIQDFFGDEFFSTDFWVLWATTFAFRPWHSAAEFQRCLRKHLPDIHSLNHVRDLDHTRYTLYESIILPITAYLEAQGVQFHFHTKVVDVCMQASRDHPTEPATISELVLREGDEEERRVALGLDDVAIVTLGSVSAGAQAGTNTAPAPHPADPDDATYGDWSLWFHLAHQSGRFGDPLAFNSHPAESKIVSFTITFPDANFVHRYEALTHDAPGTGALLSLPDSNWLLSISVPRQPVCPQQPAHTRVVWGYGLRPEKHGNVINKPMADCAGHEILRELLTHLGFPIATLLPNTITIPCVMPLATAPLLARSHADRPAVLPAGTTNLALIGQFCEIPRETTGNLEYSVRGAQMAVHGLMGIEKPLPRVKGNLLMDVFDLLVDS